MGGDSRVGEGETVSLVFPENRVHLFDRVTGDAVKNRVVEADEQDARMQF